MYLSQSVIFQWHSHHCIVPKLKLAFMHPSLNTVIKQSKGYNIIIARLWIHESPLCNNLITIISLSTGGHVKTGTFCESGSSLACTSDDGLIALIKLSMHPL